MSVTVACVVGLLGGACSRPNSEPFASEAAELPRRWSSTETVDITIGDIELSIPWFALGFFSKEQLRDTNERALERVTITVRLPDLFAEPDEWQSLSNLETVSISVVEMSKPEYPELGSAAEFAQRVRGYDGPIEIEDTLSYYEEPGIADPLRYYVFRDDALRRSDGTKPFLACSGIPIDGVVPCYSSGWLTDSTRWGYRTFSNHALEWPNIDRSVLEYISSLRKEPAN